MQTPSNKKNKWVVLDIEGTTTSLSFVHQVLFPYSAEKLPQFLKQHATTDEIVKKALLQLKLPATATLEDQLQLLQTYIVNDVKNPSLKTIQGLIWQEAFESGQVKGHIYPDVADALKLWKAKGLNIAIYSSGSVLAQKLIFKYSELGDLSPFLSFYFDTEVGGKKETQSYHEIAKELAISTAEMLFLSDHEEELTAAKSAGCKIGQVLREGVKPSLKYTEKYNTFLGVPI